MPWHLETREGKVCVIKDSDGSVAGCHDSRTDAIKQQRALYAQESRVASMYEVLDEETEEWVEAEVVPEVKAQNSELVRIEIGKEQDALIASLTDRMESMQQQQADLQLALVATLQQIGLRDPVVNVAAGPAPNVTVEAAPPAEVKVDVHVPEQAAPDVNLTVNPEIVVPQTESKKTVTFVRDYSGRIEGAEIAEE